MPGPSYNDNTCSGSPPLVLGAARGRRAFYLDEDGWLRGVTYRWPWRDGENVAECMVTEAVFTAALSIPMRQSPTAPFVMGGVIFEADPNVPAKPIQGYKWARCDGMDPECACGFYAYHNGTSRYATGGVGCRVTAIVETYGRVILGTEGMRAEKARILGVLVPPSTEATERRRGLVRAMKDAEDAIEALGSPPRRVTRITLAYYAVAAAGAVAAALMPGSRVGALLIAGYAYAAARIVTKGRRAQYEALKALLESEKARLAETVKAMPNDYHEHIERCRTNYPSVKFFNTWGELIEAFPIEDLHDLAMESKREGVPHDDK